MQVAHGMIQWLAFVKLHVMVFFVMGPCMMSAFRRTSRHNLKMEAVWPFETSVS